MTDPFEDAKDLIQKARAVEIVHEAQEALVNRARSFALLAHGDQKYGRYPYIVHLDDVAGFAKRFGAPLNVKIAAYLHDVLEDTEEKEETLRHLFGDPVTNLVVAVTKIPDLSRKEGLARNLEKVRSGGSYAVFLKVCDRLANVTRSKANNPRLFDLYKKESVLFSAILDDGETCQAAWGLMGELLK